MNHTGTGHTRRAGPPSRRAPGCRAASLRAAALAVTLALASACTNSTAGVTTQSPPATDTTAQIASTTASPATSPTTSRASATDPTGTTTPPPTTPAAPPSPSTTPKPTSRAPSGTSTSLSSAEQKDRADVEAAWTEYFKVGTTLWKKPQSQWKTLLGAVAVDPVLTRVLHSVATSKAKGKHDYGLPIHHPYWQVGVDGKDTATMGDCMDDSNTGSMDAKTGKKLTVGTATDNTSISAVKVDGTWKIANFIFLTTVPCPAG